VGGVGTSTGGDVSGTSTGAGVLIVLSVGNGVIGGCVSTGGSVSGGRDTPGVGARVLFVPASANAMVTSATMNAIDDFILFVVVILTWRMMRCEGL